MKIEHFGTVVPTFTAPKGTLYFDTVGEDLYANMDGATTWVAVGGGGGGSGPHKDQHVSGGSDQFLSTDLLEAVVKRLRESGGPTDLTVGAIADGQHLKRSGSNVIGDTGTIVQPKIWSTSERNGFVGGSVFHGSNIAYFYYLGKTEIAAVSAQVVFRVTTAGATITWAETGIFTGTLTFGANASLTRRGVTDISGDVTSTGTKTITVSLSGVGVGVDVWVAMGGQATTDYRIESTDADQIASGTHQSIAASGPLSALSTPVSATVESATLLASMITVKFS